MPTTLVVPFEVSRAVKGLVTNVAVETSFLFCLLTFLGLLVFFSVLVLLQLKLGSGGYSAELTREPLLDAGRGIVATPLLLNRDAEDMPRATVTERAPLGLGFGHVHFSG